MNNERLRIEFRVGLDKVDSSAYPEIYDEQIDIFLDDAIDAFVGQARESFEATQKVADEVRSLVVNQEVEVETVEDGVYLARYPENYLLLQLRILKVVFWGKISSLNPSST